MRKVERRESSSADDVGVKVGSAPRSQSLSIDTHDASGWTYHVSAVLGRS